MKADGMKADGMKADRVQHDLGLSGEVIGSRCRASGTRLVRRSAFGHRGVHLQVDLVGLAKARPHTRAEADVGRAPESAGQGIGMFGSVGTLVPP